MSASRKYQTFAPEDAARIIEDVKASRCFGRSTRQLKLFEYLLQKSLSGHSNDVTQYSLALDVLNRPESFDSTSDSIVRVEMHRLRANLDVYNSSNFEFLIEAPAASFDIIVKPRKQSVFTTWKNKPRSAVLASFITITAFILGYASSESVHILEHSECSKYVPNINVEYYGNPVEAQAYVEAVLRSTFSQQTSFNLIKPNGHCSRSSAPVFNIQFTILDQQNELNLVIKALDMEDTVIETHYIDGAVDDTNEGNEVHHKIIATANNISMPDSTLARFAYKSTWPSSKSQHNYGCMIAMYDSFSGELDSEFENIHSCLEDAMHSGVATLDNYGALASSYLDQARNSRASSTSAPFKAAQMILDEYGEDWINSSELAIARVYYEVGRPEFNAERMEQVLNNTQFRYSTNPQVLLTIAPYFGYSLGRWDDAKNISDYVKLIYSKRDQSVYDVDAGYAFINHGIDQTIDDCYKYYSENSIYINVLLNACAISAKDKEWVEITEANLERLKIKGGASKIAFLENRIHDRKFMKKIRSVFAEDISF